jgi:hypothetical protein
MRASRLLAVAPLVVLLAACSDGNNLIAVGKSEGVVYDGYLAGARVCVDLNVNRQCDDPPEPTAITDANGNFSLNNLTERERRFPLVAEVIPGTTIDLDTGALAPADLKYLAPAGSTAVSAFSTLIQVKIEQAIAAGLSTDPIMVPDLATLKANATAELAAELGLSGIDLTTYDPIAVKNDLSASNVVREAAAKLHIINQILSAQIVDLLPQALANADPGQESAAYAAVLRKLDVVDVADTLDTFIADNNLSLADLLDPLFDLDAVIAEVTPLTAPTSEEIDAQFNTDLNVLQSLEDMANGGEPATGATGGTGG